MNKLNTKLLIGYILLGALIIAVAREWALRFCDSGRLFSIRSLSKKEKCRRQKRSNALLNER